MTEYLIIRLLGPTVNLKLKWSDRQPAPNEDIVQNHLT